MHNNPKAAYQRMNIVDHGESFHIQAKIVACVHEAMGEDDGYATFLAIRFTFSPRATGRRARLANIILEFTSNDIAPKVVELAPEGKYIFAANRSSDTSSEAHTVSHVALAEMGGPETQERATESMGQAFGSTFANNWGRHNIARWTIQENEKTNKGIPESLILAVLLERQDRSRFIMMPKINVRVSGFDFERALAGGLNNEDPCLKVIGIPFTTPDKLSDSDLPSDDRVTAGHGERPTEVMAPGCTKDSVRPTQGHEPYARASGSREGVVQPQFDEAITGAIYAELWNTNAAESAAIEPLRHPGRWKGLGDAPDDEKLSKYFSWLKNEWKLSDLSNVDVEQQALQTNGTEDTRPMEVSETIHTLCSLLIRKAKSQKSFKSFADLGDQLFEKGTIDSIAEFFAMEEKDYNGFRQLDFGSLEILSTGKGRELSMFYIIQTPYYSSGFWSMFLIGRADPKDPNGARKLSGLIQSGADVDLEGILDETTSKAKDFGYHPLLLPYHLYTDHYKNTSTQFDVVLKTVESVEQHIMTVLQNKSETIHQFSSKDDGDDGFEISYWGLAEQSKSLHEASMKVAEVSRRRRFEIDLANALKEELKLKRPAQNQMLRELHRYDRWANAHQSEIEGMPDRIDSLKNILYSMIVKQDNVVSIRLARAGLSDSKAMKTLSIITILFLPGTFVATLFATNLVSFHDSEAEMRAYVEVVVPLTVVLMVLYGLWLRKAPALSQYRRVMRDPEAGNMRVFYKSSHTAVKRDKQS